MYMNVIGILPAQRRGAGLAGPGGAPGGRDPVAPGRRLPVRLARPQLLAGKGFPGFMAGRATGPRGPLSAARARSCLRGTAGAGLGAHACVAGSRHDSRHSARISPYLRRLAAVVVAV